ncbi:hypothetical protein EVAR_85817_1 [Eumeta japonica]|uniref:FP protein C-terminal domain-containing protein n=1 Tax=Eumeta variegata TaxID=151549 RepID=A0A4C1UQ99_EUMVA|nr:hypothetical protein EVAR_85817_1 [Eumeta japonica]
MSGTSSVWTKHTDLRDSERPRPLVLRLARRVHRDRLLAAARVRRSTTTAGLALSFDERRLYLNERLTRLNRQVFYTAHRDSLNANWKYVRTRDGKIYARKEHGTPRYRLRAEIKIEQIFGRK